MIDLTGKNILVTGASSGIGKACCVMAGSLGAKLIMIGRNEERLMQAISETPGDGHVLIAHDVTDYEGLNEKLLACIKEESLKIHGIVHAAGRDLTKPFAFTKAQDFRDLFELNLLSGLELIRLLSKKKYLPEEGASYVFISSLMASLGAAGLSAYCASKSAIISTIKALALEYAAKKCRVNSVAPGVVETPLLQQSFNMMTQEEIDAIYAEHPLGVGQPEDVAGLVAYLLSDNARWMTGQNIVIDGGYSIK